MNELCRLRQSADCQKTSLRTSLTEQRGKCEGAQGPLHTVEKPQLCLNKTGVSRQSGLSAYLWIRFLIAFTISTCRIDIRDNPMTISHCVPSNKVNWNALCSAGTNRMHAIRRADTTKERISQGLILLPAPR